MAMLLEPDEPARVNSSFVGAAKSGRTGSNAYFAAKSNEYSDLPTGAAQKHVAPAPPQEGRYVKKSLSLQDKYGGEGCQRNLTPRVHLFPWFALNPAPDTIVCMAKVTKQRTLGFEA